MCTFELIGFSDPDAVERDLKKRFAGTPYYDRLIYIPQKKMSFFLSSGNPSPHLRISVDQRLDDDEHMDVFSRLEKDYVFQIIGVLYVPLGKTLEEAMLEAALRVRILHP